MSRLKKIVVDSLIGAGVPAEKIVLEVPEIAQFGDFAFPCFSLAKEMRKSPVKIAEELAAKIGSSISALGVDSSISAVKNEGPYLNFFIKKQLVAQTVLGEVSAQKHAYGMQQDSLPKAKTIMVEFSSPNTNKPLHLGHLRNIAIGLSVSKMYEMCGNNVVRACLVNDRGIHICKSMLAYQKFAGGKEPDKKPDHFVGTFYVLFSQKAKEQPELEEKAKEMLKKWEAGDSEVLQLWKRMNGWAEQGFGETYASLGVKFDRFYYESAIYDKGKDIVADALSKGIFAEKDGAITAPLEKKGLSDKVVLRTDGTSLYITQDIYLAMLKFRDYVLDKSVYVVASEQNMHFKQLFAILGLLGFKDADKCAHLSYGMVNLPDGKMKSREGKVVDADDLIEEMKLLAASEIEERHTLAKELVAERARLIAMAALKFYLLRNDTAKDMVYDPKESISFEGETGPYVMYTYARISSIMRKHGQKVDEPADGNFDFSLYSEMEHGMIRLLAKYPAVIKDAVESLRPYIVCHYLVELSQAFNEYYHNVQILNAGDDNLKNARLLLASCVREVLKSGLSMLDIEAVEEM
jgi:arginyl-tRNA synthetase